MRVLIVSAGDDTGGVGVALARALNRHTDWEAREVHRTQNYINYPTDILWPPGQEKPSGLDDLFAKADVVHVMERWEAVQPFDGWQDKPKVIHHHGSIFRANHRALMESTATLGAVPIVSTLDLSLIDPSAEWLPNPCDIERMTGIRHSVVGYSGGAVGHSPTNRALKGTSAFVAAMEGLTYRMELVERQPWAMALDSKARCDVIFDQLTTGYGLAGIEAMAMGIPVIAGATGELITQLGIPGGRYLIQTMAKRFGYLPFLVADAETLRDRIVDLMTDQALAEHVAEIGSYHVIRYHDEAKVAKQLIGIYERALA